MKFIYVWYFKTQSFLHRYIAEIKSYVVLPIQIIADGITFMIGGLHTSGYLLYWTVHHLMLNKDIYHKLVKEMKEQVGADRGDKLKQYVYDQNT